MTDQMPPELADFPDKAALWDDQAAIDALAFPDFLGIGAVKAGTTWLHRCLYAHPGLSVPIKKPVFYFDKHFNRPLDAYGRIFPPIDGAPRGEITASYGTLPDWKIRFIHRLNPRLKVIFLMREPVRRDWSDARMELTVIQRRAAETLTEADFLAEIETEQCIHRGDYARILNGWLAHFPREQVFIGTYEDMIADPLATVRDIFAFLGVSPDVDPETLPIGRVVFKGAEIAMPEAVRAALEARHTPARLKALSDLVGIDLTAKWGYGR